MSKITSVEPQKKSASRRTRRFNIYLDGVFAFGADEDLVVDHRLVIGKTLTASDTEQLLLDVEVGKLMERIYRLFSIRQRTEKEIKDYLKKLSFKRKIKGEEEISAYIIDAVVQLMKRKDLINDQQFAKSWFEARSKKHGPNRIKQELFQKGISKDIIEGVIGFRENEEEVAQRILEKKVRIWNGLPPLEFKKKAFGFLGRRGFEYEIVSKAVEKYLKKDYN